MISPSSLHRAFQCPGSVKLSEGKTGFSSPAAERGTKIHALLAASLIADRSLIQASGLPQEDRDLCEAAHKEIMSWVEETDEILPEVQVELEPYGMLRTGRDGEHQADVVILTKGKTGKYKHAFVIDLKTGKTPVEVVTDDVINPQLMAYALGVKDKFKPRTITVGICQPALLNEVAFVPVKPGDMKAFKKKLAETVKDAANGKTFADGAHCTFCPALGVCPIKNAKRADRMAVKAQIEALVTPVRDVSVKADIRGDIVVINAATIAEAGKLREEVEILPILTKAEGKGLLKRITLFESAVEKQRKSIKAPVLALGKQIDEEAKKALTPLREAKAKLKEGLKLLEAPEPPKEVTTWELVHNKEVPAFYLKIDEKAIDAHVKSGILTGEESWITVTKTK